MHLMLPKMQGCGGIFVKKGIWRKVFVCFSIDIMPFFWFFVQNSWPVFYKFIWEVNVGIIRKKEEHQDKLCPIYVWHFCCIIANWEICMHRHTCHKGNVFPSHLAPGETHCSFSFHSKPFIPTSQCWNEYSLYLVSWNQYTSTCNHSWQATNS